MRSAFEKPITLALLWLGISIACGIVVVGVSTLLKLGPMLSVVSPLVASILTGYIYSHKTHKEIEKKLRKDTCIYLFAMQMVLMFLYAQATYGINTSILVSIAFLTVAMLVTYYLIGRGSAYYMAGHEHIKKSKKKSSPNKKLK